MIFTRRGIIYFVAIDLVLLSVAVSALVFYRRSTAPLGLEDFGSGRMRLESTAFEQNGPIPAKYTCDGENVNPPLAASGIPDGTKSLVLIMDDPDAPIGVWTHWTVWNIPPRPGRIDEATVPQGASQGTTSAGTPGYGGPCPPFGTHRYFFKLYALNDAVSLPPAADARALEAFIAPRTIDKAGLVGTFRRK